MDDSVAVYYTLLDHPIFTQCDPSILKVFMAAMLLARKKEQQIFWRGASIMVPAGCFISSQDLLGDKCGISRRSLRTALSTLESLGVLTSEATNRHTLYRLVNYGLYQLSEQVSDQQNDTRTDQLATSKRPTGDQPKEEKTAALNQWFETFWEGYWNKVGKQAARKAWPGALVNVHKQTKLKGAAARDFLIGKLAGQRELVEDNTAPLGLDALHCSTWLNGQRWNDEPKPARSKQESLWDKV